MLRSAAWPAATHGAPIAPPALAIQPPPRAARWALIFVILSVTLFSRLGLRLVGGFPVEISFIALYLLVGTLLWKGWARIDPLGFVLWALAACLATMSLLINQNFGVAPVSAGSLALLVTIYLPFAFTLRLPGDARAAWRWAARAFGNVALFCALAGIAQFYAQFFISDPWLFQFSDLLPWRLQGPGGYHTVIPVGELTKSNGFFLREPSHFSLLMALALLLEWQLGRRLWRLALLALALLLSYSGTGLLALGLGLMFPLGRRTLIAATCAALAGLLLVWLLGDTLNLQFTLDRLAEFGSERSSAYARYVAPVRRLAEEIDAQSWSLLMGQGPGSMQRSVRATASFDPTWAKLLFEYGLLGFAAVVALVLRGAARSVAVSPARAVLIAGWFVMGGYLLSPEYEALLYLLLCGWADPGNAAQGKGGRSR